MAAIGEMRAACYWSKDMACPDRVTLIVSCPNAPVPEWLARHYNISFYNKSLHGRVFGVTGTMYITKKKNNRWFRPLAVGSWCGLFAMIQAATAQTWIPAMAPVTNWQSVAASADGTKLVAAAGGFLGSGGGPIWISTNSGSSWTPTQAPITNWLYVASSADGTKLVAAGYHIYYSLDSGNSWTQAIAPAPFEFWSSVVSSADGSLWAAGEIGGTAGAARGLYLSTDSGMTWHSSNTNGSAVAGSADGRKLVGIEYHASVPYVIVSTNAGSTWKSNSVPAPSAFWVAASSADGTKLAVASGGEIISETGPIYTSTDSGLTWISNKAPVARWTSIASSADGNLLAATALKGGIYTSIDSGTTWVSNNAPATNWTCVASSADGSKLVAVVNGGGIYTCSSIPTPVLKMAATNGNLALSWTIPSANFVLQQSYDLGGSNWTTLTNSPSLNFTNLQDQVALPPPSSNGFYRLATPP